MNILWVCGSSIVGGAERATLQIGALLRARGHAVRVACPAASALVAAARAAQLDVVPTALGGSLNLAGWAAVARRLAALRPDVALVTTADEWIWACLSRRASPSTRLVLVRHMALPLARRVRWLAARRADAVVAVSDSVAESLAGVAPARLHLIGNPVRFAPRAEPPDGAERRRARRALGLPTAERWVGFFGGHDPHKGLIDVARAVQAASRSAGPTHLLIGGRGGAGGARARELSRACGLDGYVHDLGEIDDMAQALTAVDVVAMATASRLGEALPATLLEAMACGTPVLAYGASGMRDAIGEDGVAGRLARPDDASDLARVLSEMLADPPAAEHLARAALARVRERFDATRIADQYEDLFRRLC